MPGGLAPWERRAELGFRVALGRTLELLLSSPGRFFSHLRYGDLTGAHRFFFICAVLPQAVSLLIGALFPSAGLGGLAYGLLSRMDGVNPAMLESLRGMVTERPGPLSLLLSLVFVPLAALAGVYLAAGLSHLVLLLLGRATAGWTATRKVFLYAAATSVLNVVPVVGGLLAATWASVLEVMGLARAHRTSTLMATLAVFGWHLMAICCCCGPVLVAAFASSMASRVVVGS